MSEKEFMMTLEAATNRINTARDELKKLKPIKEIADRKATEAVTAVEEALNDARTDLDDNLEELQGYDNGRFLRDNFIKDAIKDLRDQIATLETELEVVKVQEQLSIGYYGKLEEEATKELREAKAAFEKLRERVKVLEEKQTREIEEQQKAMEKRKSFLESRSFSDDED
jgi:hypothetical protein